jgi:hypothetical protein
MELSCVFFVQASGVTVHRHVHRLLSADRAIACAAKLFRICIKITSAGFGAAEGDMRPERDILDSEVPTCEG